MQFLFLNEFGYFVRYFPLEEALYFIFIFVFFKFCLRLRESWKKLPFRFQARQTFTSVVTTSPVMFLKQGCALLGNTKICSGSSVSLWSSLPPFQVAVVIIKSCSTQYDIVASISRSFIFDLKLVLCSTN